MSGSIDGAGVQCVDCPVNQLTENSFINCIMASNDGKGVFVYRSGNNFTVTGGNYYSNGGSAIAFQWPTGTLQTAESGNNIKISGVTMQSNGAGISITGFYVASTVVTTKLVYGHGQEAYAGPLIDNCRIIGSSGYGIIIHANYASITNCHIRKNGTSNHAGICANTQAITITGNTICENIYWGIDAGAILYGIISGNIIQKNSGCGINLGAAIDVAVTSNHLYNNGDTEISISKYDSGTYAFVVSSTNIHIASNVIRNDSATAHGIISRWQQISVSVYDNKFYGFDTTGYNDIILNSVNGDIRGNSHNGLFVYNDSMKTSYIMPDWADVLRINNSAGSTVTLSNITYYSRNYWVGKVTSATLTAAGSGYTSAPTVTFSGGGSPTTVATATARLRQDGTVGQIEITDGGVGYSAVPTITLSGGGGSGATGTVTVNSAALQRREFTLLTIGGIVRVAKGTSFILATNSTAYIELPELSSMKFMFSDTRCYEISRMHSGGTIFADQIALTLSSTTPTPDNTHHLMFIDSASQDWKTENTLGTVKTFTRT